MRDITLRIGTKVFQFQISDDEVRAMFELGFSADPLSLPGRPSLSVKKRMKERKGGKRLSDADWSVVLETFGQSPARSEKSTFRVLQNKKSGELLGTIKSEKTNDFVTLGHPKDPTSRIYQVEKAIRTMPMTETFTRRDILEILPSYAARGDILKFGLSYFEQIGMIAKLPHVEGSNKPFQFKRLELKSDDLRTKIEHQGAEVIGR